MLDDELLIGWIVPVDDASDAALELSVVFSHPTLGLGHGGLRMGGHGDEYELGGEQNEGPFDGEPEVVHVEYLDELGEGTLVGSKVVEDDDGLAVVVVGPVEVVVAAPVVAEALLLTELVANTTLPSSRMSIYPIYLRAEVSCSRSYAIVTNGL